jgi:uncharacterized protein (TIGR02271 family)
VSSVTIPVHAEQVTVKTRRSELGRVRMTKTVREEHVTVESPAVTREVVVERVPIDRFVERPSGRRREGETLVIPVFEEVPVVVMKTKLKEEIRITTRAVSQRRRIPVTIRREQVSVDRLPAGAHQVAPVTPKERKS